MNYGVRTPYLPHQLYFIPEGGDELTSSRTAGIGKMTVDEFTESIDGKWTACEAVLNTVKKQVSEQNLLPEEADDGIAYFIQGVFRPSNIYVPGGTESYQPMS